MVRPLTSMHTLYRTSQEDKQQYEAVLMENGSSCAVQEKTQHAHIMYILIFHIMCAILQMIPTIMLAVRLQGADA